MARPTTWRRSWGRGQGLAGNVTLIDLLLLQPGETLGRVWWTYLAQHGPVQANVYRPRDSVMIAAMTVRDVGDPNISPLADASTEDWLWWEPIYWEPQFTTGVDNLWMLTAWGPRADRVATTQRRNSTESNQVLSVMFETDDAAASNAFVNATQYQVAVSALIILP